MGKILAVNLHGQINVPSAARKALVELGIEKRFSATVVPDDPQTVGALKLCKDYLAWAQVDNDLLAELLKKRGTLSKRKRLDDSSLKSLGYESYADVASSIDSGSGRLSSIRGIRPFFNLGPPKGGFKRSTRRAYREGGVLGENPNLLEIVRRML